MGQAHPAYLFTLMGMMPVTTPGMTMVVVVAVAVCILSTDPLIFVILMLFVRMLASA